MSIGWRILLMKTDHFSQKVIIITGASSGIGKALALQLAEQGAYLALAARDKERLEALSSECEQRGGKAIVAPTDVSDEAQCQKLIQQTLEAYQQIDMLINNAGISVVARLDELNDLRLFKQVMEVNFYGALYCTYHALSSLKQNRGRIVNISSLGGFLAVPHNSAYNASKFAIQGFSDALRMELAQEGISVTVICPYWVITEFHERYLNKEGVPKGPSGRAIYKKGMMTADQCAKITIQAAWKRKREIVMWPGPMAAWMRLIVPSLVEWLTIQTFLKPAAKRVEKQSKVDP
jgi:short-subunit dehydrogenase